ncbi:MAG TPA: G1 family glutamic endopeptidase [Thermomicrobiales bacterium]|nr:G1 family glutamic endopeptidase [Thermomicrobiales bacterium]
MPESAISFYAKAASLDMTWAATLHCKHTGIVHWPGAATGRSGESIETTHIINPSWSGYQIDNLAHYVQSGWTIPTVVNPPIGHRYSTSGYASSIWAGMGGGTSNLLADRPLIQAGSSQYLSAANVASYYFWYEIVGGSAGTSSEIQVGSPVAHPGDDVATVSIWLEDTHSTEFGICDFSDSSPPGGCTQIEWNCPEDGNCSEEPGAATTEWIVEAPSAGYGVLPLADFGLVDFYNGCWSATSDAATCYAISEPGVTVPVAFWLYRNVFQRRQYLATPGPITFGSSFTDTYHLPQNPNQ